MSQVVVKLPYGQTDIEVTVPRRNLIGVYSPKDVPPVGDLAGEIRRCLDHPIGSARLRELTRGKRNAVIIADDNTRLTPADQIIPPLLDEMNAAGLPDERITVVIALGTHRFMTEGEILAKFGREVVSRVAIRNHDFKTPAALVDLGVTANGTPIFINRQVYEADFKIGIGSIVPHHIPGFSGGAKIVQPGISGEKTTAQTHLLSVRAPRSFLGVEDNPVRRELDQIANQIDMRTIFNTVLNRHGQVVGAFFGDVQKAFAEGVRLSRRVYAIEIPEAADIVIAGSHPCDIEFWQAHKTLYPSDLAVKAGGTIILATPCTEGVAVTHGAMTGITRHSAAELRQMVEAGKLQDEVAAALAIAWAQVKERESVFFVSSGIVDDDVRALGFTPFAGLQQAFDAALAKHGPAARVSVLTHAPDMLPIVPGNR